MDPELGLILVMAGAGGVVEQFTVTPAAVPVVVACQLPPLGRYEPFTDDQEPDTLPALKTETVAAQAGVNDMFKKSERFEIDADPVTERCPN